MDYIIEFDYNADEIDELTIRKGDIVNDVKPHEDGWLLGNLRGKGGVFPSNFGRPLKDEKKKSQEETVTDIIDDNKTIPNVEETEPSEQRSQKKVARVGFGNIFSGGNIHLKSNRDGKTMSVIEEVKSDLPVDKKSSPKAKVMAKVIHSYKAENPDELSLEDGEILTVLDKDNEDEGWWKGQLGTGKIGLFPDNFVEIIKTTPHPEDVKPNRPANTVTIKGPPPVLSAKPTLIKTTPPRPPQLSDSKVLPVRPTSRLINSDKEDGISFESPVNHKPLVGPNAGRAKRPGKKLPSSVNLGTNVNITEDNEENLGLTVKQTSSKENTPLTPDFTTNEIPVISKLKSKDNSLGENNSSDNFHSKLKSKDISSSLERVPEKTPDIVVAKPKGKEFFTSETSGTKTKVVKENTISASKSPEFPEPKSGNIFKTNSMSKKVIPDSEPSIQSLDDLNVEIKGLGVKIGALEEENQELKAELLELRKSSNDQINQLKTKMTKLINEFDEDKAKHAVNEVNWKRLRDTVDDLQIAMSLK